MNVKDLKGQTIAFAASGGLDSCTITHWLTSEGVKVVAFYAPISRSRTRPIFARSRNACAPAAPSIS